LPAKLLFAKGRIFAVEISGGVTMETSPCVHPSPFLEIFVIKFLFIARIFIFYAAQKVKKIR
jgi:hypothetical protein